MGNKDNNVLESKKILFFAPEFFNYETIIKQKMTEMGGHVFFYNERSVKGALPRAINKIFPSLFNKHSHNYFHRILIEHQNEKFDYILVIKSDMMPESTLIEIREKFRDAKLILYLYDSLSDIPMLEKKLKYYDRILTFDREDAIDRKFVFRPLFFSDDYIKYDNSIQYQYDLAFLGTIHTDRFRILKKLMKQAKEKNFNAYWFFFLQARFMFYWYWLTRREFKWGDKEIFSTDKKSGSEIAQIVNQTKTVIDIESPGQKGLTMRTIEMMGLKKKLITTNRDIVNYDFFDPNNICVIDREEPIVLESFMKSPYKEIPHQVYWRYHISSWILDVLDINNNNNNV